VRFDGVISSTFGGGAAAANLRILGRASSFSSAVEIVVERSTEDVVAASRSRISVESVGQQWEAESPPCSPEKDRIQ